jgi:hypothetical protein
VNCQYTFTSFIIPPNKINHSKINRDKNEWLDLAIWGDGFFGTQDTGKKLGLTPVLTELYHLLAVEK